MKNIALVGGMDRLGPHYNDEATRLGVSLTILTALEVPTASRIRNVDAVLIFTNKISHNLKREAIKAARSGKVTVFYCHACGLCTLRTCLECLRYNDADNRFPRKGGVKTAEDRLVADILVIPGDAWVESEEVLFTGAPLNVLGCRKAPHLRKSTG